MATPGVAGRDLDLSNGLLFTAENGHCDLLLIVGLEQLLQGVVVLVKASVSDGHDEIEERL